MDTNTRAEGADDRHPPEAPTGLPRDVLRGPGEIAEDDAGGALAQTYAQLRTTLSVTFVPTVFRMLARHERYLAAAVTALAPEVAAPRGRCAAAAIRAAGADLPARMPPPRLSAGTTAPAVHQLLTRYNYANSTGLLLIRALGRGLPANAGVMDLTPAPEYDDLLEDIRRAHGDVTIPGLWRELHDGWSPLAAAAWTHVRELAGRDEFHATRDRVIAIADHAIAAVSAPSPERLADPEGAEAIKRILTAFQILIPTMIVEIEWLRAAVAPEGR